MNKLIAKLFGYHTTEALLLSFEYGVHMTIVANKEKIDITHDLMVNAEELIEGEFTSQSTNDNALNMGQNIMAMLSTENKTTE